MMEQQTTPGKQAILDKQRQYLWPNHILYYTEPLPLDHGEGLYVWDVEGRRYLDFFGGILTTSVGHNSPRVVKAVRDQVGELIHSSTLYPNANHVELAETERLLGRVLDTYGDRRGAARALERALTLSEGDRARLGSTMLAAIGSAFTHRDVASARAALNR